MKLAESVSLTHDEGVRIDGIVFPFWVGEDVEIEPGGNDALTVVHLPLLVRGVVTLRGRNGSKRVIDSELGDVGAWARALVRAGLLDAFPWLKVPLTVAPPAVGTTEGESDDE